MLRFGGTFQVYTELGESDPIIVREVNLNRFGLTTSHSTRNGRVNALSWVLSVAFTCHPG